jgi:glyoxalase-like protein
MADFPRLRQAVIAARDLDQVAGQLRAKLGLAEPYQDPEVERFGLRNAVFALNDTFLEVVSPIRADAPAARLLERRRGDSGYMLMFQVDDLDAARERARALDVREVFDVSVDGMAEVHLHPADMRGAIVSLSRPQPPQQWRWGGPNWEERSAPYTLTGATVTVTQPVAVVDRWQTLLDTELYNIGIRVSADEFERGLTEIVLAADDPEQVPQQRGPLVIGGVRFVFEDKDATEERRSKSVFEPTD